MQTICMYISYQGGVYLQTIYLNVYIYIYQTIYLNKYFIYKQYISCNIYYKQCIFRISTQFTLSHAALHYSQLRDRDNHVFLFKLIW